MTAENTTVKNDLKTDVKTETTVGAVTQATPTAVQAPPPPTATLEREFRVEVRPMRQILAGMGEIYDSNVLINADPMAARYPKIKKTVEEYIARIYGEDIYVGFFNYDDLRSKSQLGYYVMSTGSFEAGTWTDLLAAKLGVSIDATGALRVGNKYVCFVLRRLRDDRLVKSWEQSSEKLARSARREAGADKPISELRQGEISAEFDDQLETVQHQKRKRTGRR